MEDWQCEHIIKNLSKLASNTIFNYEIQSELRAEHVLGKADLEKLNAEINQNGNSKASHLCYEWLMGRTNAYKILTKALVQGNQTGAARILIEGVPTELFSKPLTYLGILTKLKEYQNVNIEVHGKVLKLKKFFRKANNEILQQMFQETVSELEIYDTFITKQRTFVLAINTLPPKPQFYVSRFLSNRIKIDELIFRADCPDVFVFKKPIARYKLSQIASPNYTADSTSQLTNITSRFIYLDEYEDWIELKRKCRHVPIHLINYEGSENMYLLEDTSAPSDILEKLGSQNQRVYISEQDFVRQQLSEKCTSSSVCICDTPGMGKTFLLANIARLMTKTCTGRLVVFIQLTTFATYCLKASSDTISDPKISLNNVIEYISHHPKLLLKLVKAEILQLELFFDGFDEVPEDDVKWTKQFFQSITTNFPNVRSYITSRPHLRQELQECLGVVAYDMLPFNQENQIDFLVQCWRNYKPDSVICSLKSYATNCLKVVNKSLTKNDKEITGIPLLCQLISEIYADKVKFHSTRKRKLSDVPLQISGMYQHFIEKRISLVVKNKEEFDNFKLVHVWHALKLLFPESGFDRDNLLESIEDILTSPQIVRIGILQKHSNAALEFIHRTFAEYLVADYISTKLQDHEIQKTKKFNCSSVTMLKLLLKVQKSRWEDHFSHPMIVFFFNSALGEVNISDEIKIQVATFISSISNEDFINILCACSKQNLFNTFSLLRESLTKLDDSRMLEIFSNENSYKLLKVCTFKSTCLMFHSCIQLLTVDLKLDLAPIKKLRKDRTLLELAVLGVNYEAVEYFVDSHSLQNQSHLMQWCVHFRDEIEKRENILNLLHNKEPTLIHKTPDILLTFNLDMRFFKILVKFGANLTAVSQYGDNCAMYAARYMSSNDFHELVQFSLTDLKADYLFLPNEKWKHPLPHIIQQAPLLPETLEMLLNIPGIEINMMDADGDNLLFSAAKGNSMNNFQQLVDRGLDFNARGCRNRSLLHVTAGNKGAEMMPYLLSLEMNPNSRDEDGRTPLHCAAGSFLNPLCIVKVLVENGANVQAKDEWGQTALHLYCATNYPDIEVIEYLIGKGSEVNDRDNDGNTPLHLCKKKIAMEYLIEMGADICAKNKMGQTPAQNNPDLCKPSCWYSDSYKEDGMYRV